MRRHLMLFFLALVGGATAQLSAQHLTNSVTIPLQTQYNRVLVPARIHDQGPYSFLVDTGSALTTLHPQVVDALKLERSGRVRIIGISGEERAPTYAGVPLDFGPVTYSPRRVASLESERQQSRRRDGVLGSGFFRSYVVEINSRDRVMRLHSSTNFAYGGSGTIVPLRFVEDTPIVSGTILSPGANAEGEFEIDTGCDSGICLGQSFTEKHQLLRAASAEPSEKFGVGGSVNTQSGTVPALRLAAVEFKEPQTDFFTEGSPVDEPLAGHIGMGVLGRRIVIFDYARKRMIIEN